MTSRIFLIDQDETLRALPEHSYDTKDRLQELLEKYPEDGPPRLIEGRFNGTLAEGTITEDEYIIPDPGENID